MAASGFVSLFLSRLDTLLSLASYGIGTRLSKCSGLINRLVPLAEVLTSPLDHLE